MNKEERNSFRKEIIGKLEEQWAKSNSPKDDLFYYHPSEDKIVLSHALFWVMTQNIKGKVGKEKYLLLLRQYQEEMLEAYLDGIRRFQRPAALLQHHVQFPSYVASEHVRIPYSFRCSQASRHNNRRWRLWW